MERERRNKIGISYDAPESKMVTLWLHFTKKWPSQQRRPKMQPIDFIGA
jgi:hypothetical protein